MISVTVGILFMVLVAIAVPLESGQDSTSTESPRNLNTRDAELCYNQDATLVPRATVFSHAALEKSSSVYEVLTTFFANRLSACQASVRYIRKSCLIIIVILLQFSMMLPHNLVILNYKTTHFDVNNIIPAMESNHNCSVSN